MSYEIAYCVIGLAAWFVSSVILARTYKSEYAAMGVAYDIGDALVSTFLGVIVGAFWPIAVPIILMSWIVWRLTK